MDKAERESQYPLQQVEGPFQLWASDFIGTLPTTCQGNRYMLTAIDYATRWPIARAVPNATSCEAVKFMYEKVSR